MKGFTHARMQKLENLLLAEKKVQILFDVSATFIYIVFAKSLAYSGFIVLTVKTLQNISKASNNNIIYGFGKET